MERAKQEQINAANKMKKSATSVDLPEPPPRTKGAADSGGAVTEASTEQPGGEGGKVYTWLCLRCGSQACGEGGKNHALAHYKTPR